MLRENIEDFFAVALATAADHVSEHEFFSRIVRSRVEAVAATLKRIADRPPCECARDRDNIRLCVAAIDAERVELHQLTRVVLVQPPLALVLPVFRLVPASEAEPSD